MPSPSTIPPELLTRPFTVAEASELGVARDVLRGARLRAPFRGVRVPAHLPCDLRTSCAAARLVLPADARFRGLTAALLHGVPLPRWTGEAPLHVATSRRGLRIAGVHVHVERTRPAADEVFGLPVSTLAQTWGELGENLCVDDLVVAADHLLRHTAVSHRTLTEVAAEWSGRRGVQRLRQSLPLLDGCADSPMESRLRLLLVRAGLPAPVSNRDVIEDGAWLARPDLSYPERRIAIEYEGDHHRTDRRQWKRDKARRRLLEDHGWLVIEVIDDDVYKTPELTVARIRAAVVARGG